MNKGDLIFRKFSVNESKDDFWYFLNYGISKVSNSPYTHVGICVDKKEDYYTIAESTANGFVLNIWDAKSLEDRIASGKWESLEVKGLDKTNLKEYAEGLVGIPYGYFDYIKFISYYLTGKKLFKDSSKSMVCSESVATLLYLCKVDIRDDNNYGFDYIAPKDVYNKVISL